MNSIVGINVNVTENASAVAPRIVDQLSKIGDTGEDAGERIQKAFDTAQLGSQFEKFAGQIDKLYEMKYGKDRDLKTQNLELRNQAIQRRLEGQEQQERNVTPHSLQAENLIRGVGGSLSQMGGTGNALPAVESGLGTLSGMISKAGPAGMAIGAGVAVLGGATMVIDALSKQYEQFIPTLMDTTAAFGDLKTSVYDNSITFRKSLDEAAKSANKFGYSVEQGMEVSKSLAAGGLTSSTAKGLSEQQMAYARGYGIQSPTALSGAQILSSRYNQGNVLGMTAGGLGASGMGAGRFEEYLQAMTSTFEESLSRGVVKGFSDITSSMNFFSKLGETWKGQLGATRINQLSGAVTQATSLQKETDVLMFRAAQSMVSERMGGKGTYLDVMKEMEKGITPALFKQFGQQISTLTGGNKTDMVEMMREAFGTNYTTSIDLVDSLDKLSVMTDKQINELIKEAAPPSAASAEMQLLQAENSLRQNIITLGENMIETKAGIVKAAGDVIGEIEKWIGADVNKQSQALKDKETTEKRQQFAQDYGSKFYDDYIWKLQNTPSGKTAVRTLSDTGITPTIGSIFSNNAYASQQPAAKEMISLLSQSSSGAMGLLSGKYKDELTKSLQWVGNRDTRLDPGEIDVFLPMLKNIMKKAESDVQTSYAKIGTTPKVGTLSALSAYTQYDTTKDQFSQENAEQNALQSIVDLQKKTSTGKGVFESDASYQNRIKQNKQLETALTGMTTGQIEALESTGGFSSAVSQAQKKDFFGNLTGESIESLIKAINALTLSMNQPITITTQDARQ
jgi:hypothetical protein